MSNQGGAARHQISGTARKRDIPPVDAEGWRVKRIVISDAIRSSANEGRCAGLQIAHEDLGESIGSARHQIGGVANKRDVSAVWTDGRKIRRAISLSVRSGAHQRGRASLHVAHEHLIIAGTSRHQIV